MRLERSEDLDNAYKLFGVCAHHCSNIEHSVAFLLHPVKWGKHFNDLERKKQELYNKLSDIKEWTAAMREFDKMLDQVHRDIDILGTLPLGQLIEQIKSNYSLSSEQVQYLKDILEKRNYVIHKIWGSYGRRLKDPLLIKEMVKELQDSEAYFRIASKWLSEQAYLVNGIPERMR